MNYNDIRKLVKLVESSHIEELEIGEEGFQVRVTKTRPGNVMPFQPPVQMLQSPAPAVPPVLPTTPAPGKPDESAPALPENLIEVKSPMVGTFYHASAPDAPPFVKEGDTVKNGQVLCIIEAMKLMNEIEAEVPGRIVKILVENAHPVEFGQPLFLIEKA
ncbi:MAG TPA: acetyl-CoA carboxylase biotin carboxyl carrier protein [bacterium]|nr:acetyl-CoA carboxylase biotin carboxyl carrier protein [bacterium]